MIKKNQLNILLVALMALSSFVIAPPKKIAAASGSRAGRTRCFKWLRCCSSTTATAIQLAAQSVADEVMRNPRASLNQMIENFISTIISELSTLDLSRSITGESNPTDLARLLAAEMAKISSHYRIDPISLGSLNQEERVKLIKEIEPVILEIMVDSANRIKTTSPRYIPILKKGLTEISTENGVTNINALMAEIFCTELRGSDTSSAETTRSTFTEASQKDLGALRVEEAAASGAGRDTAECVGLGLTLL